MVTFSEILERIHYREAPTVKSDNLINTVRYLANSAR